MGSEGVPNACASDVGVEMDAAVPPCRGAHRSRWATAAACVVILVAVATISGWATDVGMLKSLRPEWATMKVNTAIGLILCSLALLLLVCVPRGNPLRGLVGVFAGVVCIGGVLIICEHLFGFDLFIHRFLVPADEIVSDRMIAGRMSPSTALCLVLAGAGILLAWRWKADLHPLVAALGFSVALLGGFTLAAYVVDEAAGRRLMNYTGMAAHTAICFILLGSAVAALVPPGELRKWELDRRTTLGFFAGLLLMLAAVSSAYHFTEQSFRSAEWVEHRQKVLRQVNDLTAGLASIAGKERAFLLTGEEELLVRWESAKDAVLRSFHDLRELTTDNPRHRERLDRIEPLIERRVLVADNAIAERRDGAEADGGMRAAFDGFQLEKEVEAWIAEIEREELARLAGDEVRAKEVTSRAFLLLPMWVSLGVTLLLGGLFFLNHGVARRLAAERHVRELNASLEHRVEERTSALELANKELDSFCYSVSHDLRSPLRAISGFTKVISDRHASHFDETGRDYMARVLAATERMGNLIDDLLKLSRVTREELNPAPVDLSAMAGEIVEELRQASPGRDVRVEIQADLEALGDPRLLRVMMENLLGNAWKFTSKTANARIEFRADAAEGGGVFHVADNGAGFDMKYADKLFGPFQRLHRQGEFPGTGIGLATVQRIVHRHGGRVWAEASIDDGATFSFTL